MKHQSGSWKVLRLNQSKFSVKSQIASLTSAALCNLCLEYSVIALSCPHPAVAKSDVKITKDHSTEIDHASSLKRCAQK